MVAVVVVGLLRAPLLLEGFHDLAGTKEDWGLDAFSKDAFDANAADMLLKGMAYHAGDAAAARSQGTGGGAYRGDDPPLVVRTARGSRQSRPVPYPAASQGGRAGPPRSGECRARGGPSKRRVLEGPSAAVWNIAARWGCARLPLWEGRDCGRGWQFPIPGIGERVIRWTPNTRGIYTTRR